MDDIKYPDDTTLMAENEEEWKRLMRVKEEREKGGLKLSIQKLRSWYPVPLLHGKYMGKHLQILFSWAPKSPQMVTIATKLKDAYSLEEKLSQN